MVRPLSKLLWVWVESWLRAQHHTGSVKLGAGPRLHHMRGEAPADRPSPPASFASDADMSTFATASVIYSQSGFAR
eukprot:4330785-Pleurochrysis_carterae.AAC.2